MSSKSKKIFVLGATGMLGHKMCQVLSGADEFYVYGGLRGRAEAVKALPFFQDTDLVGGLDVNDWGRAKDSIANLKPDVIVNCVGLTTRKIDPAASAQVVELNALLPHRLAHLATDLGARMIHFSTDCVFQGGAGPYAVDHPKDAQDLYGMSKALGEVDAPGCLTIRSSIVGREIRGFTEFFEWIFSQKGQGVSGFTKALYNGLTTKFMAELVRDLILQSPDIRGILQIGSQPASKAQLIQQVSDIFDLGITVNSVDQGKDKTLQTQVAQQDIGFQPPTWAELISDLKRENHLYEGIQS